VTCSTNRSFKIVLWRGIGECIQEKNHSLSCDVCDKSFKVNGALIVHQRTHTGERPYSCNGCDKSFNQNSILTKHRQTHTGERPFPCDVCDKSFSQSNNMMRHRRIHIIGEKSFSCDVCDKLFNDCSSLIVHQRMHAGEKPFSCNMSGKQVTGERIPVYWRYCNKKYYNFLVFLILL